MKTELHALKVYPAPGDRDSEASRVHGIGKARFAEDIKSAARRMALQSSATLAPSSAFGCVDWFCYPAGASKSAGTTDPKRS
jgi:hypothetical protein